MGLRRTRFIVPRGNWNWMSKCTKKLFPPLGKWVLKTTLSHPWEKFKILAHKLLIIIKKQRFPRHGNLYQRLTIPSLPQYLSTGKGEGKMGKMKSILGILEEV